MIDSEYDVAPFIPCVNFWEDSYYFGTLDGLRCIDTIFSDHSCQLTEYFDTGLLLVVLLIVNKKLLTFLSGKSELYMWVV